MPPEMSSRKLSAKTRLDTWPRCAFRVAAGPSAAVRKLHANTSVCRAPT